MSVRTHIKRLFGRGNGPDAPSSLSQISWAPNEDHDAEGDLSTAATESQRELDVGEASRFSWRPKPSATSTSLSEATTLAEASSSPSGTRCITDGVSNNPRQRTIGIETLYSPPEGLLATVDIVFIHGITGSSRGTWTYRRKGVEVFWSAELLRLDIPDARILTFGYDANVVNWTSAASANRLANHAENLLGGLSRFRERSESSHRPVIFVMHSLGGLVVQNALDLSRSSPEPHLRLLEACTTGLAFLGTPHFGSDLASWGAFWTSVVNLVKTTNTNIVQVLHPDSEVLAIVQRKFHEVLRIRQSQGNAIKVACFYEELQMAHVGLVVPMSSAILLGYPSYGIHADHREMVRFESRHNKHYESVTAEIVRWTKEIRSAVSQTTEVQEECLRALYFDGLDSRETAIGSPMNDTFQWVWDTTRCTFVDWLTHLGGLYWVRGRASSGKSTLIKYIATECVEMSKPLTAREPIVLAYYIDKNCQNPLGNTLQGISRALLWKLLRRDGYFFRFVLPLYEERKKTRQTATWEADFTTILAGILKEECHRPIWIFIDGLDECSDDYVDLADSCNALASMSASGVRICISSRPEQELSCTLNAGKANVLELQEHTAGDIKTYTLAEINRLEPFLDVVARQHLLRYLTKRAGGLFMWVKLASRDVVRECIRGETDTTLLCRRLKRLPREVKDLYLDILDKQTRSDHNVRLQSLAMLGIVAAGRRPFTLQELDFLVGSVLADSPLPIPIIPVNEQAIRRKIDTRTGGLLDCRSGRVVFSHDTVAAFVRGFLAEQDDLVELRLGHLGIGAVCVSLLHDDQAVLSSLKQLQVYAARHWVYHVRLGRQREAVIQVASRRKIPVRNIDFWYWRQMHLARCWDSSASAPLSSHPVSTCLSFVVFSIIPPEIFHHSVREVGDSALPNILSTLLNPERWHHLDRDVLIWFEFAPGYRIGIHAEQMLRDKLGKISCVVSSPISKTSARDTNLAAASLQEAKARSISPMVDPMAAPFRKPGEKHNLDFGQVFQAAKQTRRVICATTTLQKKNERLIVSCDLACEEKECRKISQGEDWIDLHVDAENEQDAAGSPSRRFGDPISDEDKRTWDPKLPCDIKEVYADRVLLDELRVVIWHYTRLGWDAERAHLQLASPIHYAAFFGLSAIIEKLCDHGADVNHVSAESEYGTPLLAAIWGLSTREYATINNCAIKTLVRRGARVDTAANASYLGVRTPLAAAVRLHAGYRKRAGVDSGDLTEAIRTLIDGGARIDPATRAMASASPHLRRYFTERSWADFSSYAASMAATPPIPIPNSEGRLAGKSMPAARGAGTVGDFGPFRMGMGMGMSGGLTYQGLVRPQSTGTWLGRLTGDSPQQIAPVPASPRIGGESPTSGEIAQIVPDLSL